MTTLTSPRTSLPPLKGGEKRHTNEVRQWGIPCLTSGKDRQTFNGMSANVGVGFVLRKLCVLCAL